MTTFVELPISPETAAVYAANFTASENKQIIRSLGLTPNDVTPVVLFRGDRWKLLGVKCRYQDCSIVLENLSTGKFIAVDDGIVPLISAARAGYHARYST